MMEKNSANPPVAVLDSAEADTDVQEAGADGSEVAGADAPEDELARED